MSMFGVVGRNNGQKQLMRALQSNAPLVFVTGKAGTGKNVVSVGYALHQLLEERNFRTLIYTRNPVDLGKEQGFLPGTAEEKHRPYFAPFFDTLGVVSEQKSLEHYIGKNILLEPIHTMRGRTFHDTILLVDEAQNLDLHTLGGILTRAGERTKVVVMGNFLQIDDEELRAPEKNGMYRILDGLYKEPKHAELFRHVNLTQGERSPLADAIEDIMYRQRADQGELAAFVALEGKGEDGEWSRTAI